MLVRRDAASLLLKRGAWFGGLPSGLQDQILARALERSYSKNQVIAREGRRGIGLCAVLEGRLKTYSRAHSDHDMLVHIAGAGYWFGIYGVLSRGAPHLDTVRADTNVKLLVLSLGEFQRIVDEEPHYYPYFTDLLIERFELLYQFLAELGGLPAEERLELRIRALADLRRRHEAVASPVSIRVSQAELATMVGLSRQTLSTLLARLEKRGVIKIGFRDIRILD